MSEKMFNSYDDKPSPGADDLFLLWDNQESKVKDHIHQEKKMQI